LTHAATAAIFPSEARIRMLRIVLGIVAGAIAGSIVVGLVETLGMMLFPSPPGLDFSSPEAARASAAQIPPGSVASIGVAWGLGALVGGFVAARIAQRAWAAWVIAALLIAASLINLVMIPSPIWLWIGGIGAIIVGGWLAGRFGPPKAAAT
jgi:hypothetical protein